MEIVNVHNAKIHFSRLLDRAQEGQEFVIAKAGRWPGSGRSRDTERSAGWACSTASSGSPTTSTSRCRTR
jgi:hypothetical protein